MANAAMSASAKEIPVASVRSSRMRAKPFRTKRKSASAERCLRPWGAAIDIGTPTCRKQIISVRGTLSQGGLRKGHPDSQVMTGFYRSPGIAVSQPTCKVKDTNWRRILAKRVSDEWSPETLRGVVSMMAATLLSLKGHFCPSFTPNREKNPSSDAKIAWFNLTP